MVLNQWGFSVRMHETSKQSTAILEKIKEDLENLTQSSIDVVNFRDSLRPLFKQNILKDAILI